MKHKEINLNVATDEAKKPQKLTKKSQKKLTQKKYQEAIKLANVTFSKAVEPARKIIKKP